jgi:cholesterol oxidase
VATRRLSSAVDRLDDHYEVVVVGSGYGGGIAASRLARAGRQVCLLEQGRELVPGEYPRNALDAAGEMQFDLPSRHLGRRTGLYHFRIGPGISAFHGCGLGGTSLVNANVAIPINAAVAANVLSDNAVAAADAAQQAAIDQSN